jgi:hypothetical protein
MNGQPIVRHACACGKWAGVVLLPYVFLRVQGGSVPWAAFFALLLLAGSDVFVSSCVLLTLAVFGIVMAMSSDPNSAIVHVINPSSTTIPHVMLAFSVVFAFRGQLLDATFMSWLTRQRLTRLVTAPRRLLPCFALLCFVCALFRRHPADLLVSAGLLSLVFFWKWPRAPRQEPRGAWRSRIVNAGVLLLSTLVSLALLEVAVRCLFTSPETHQNVYIGLYDPQYVFTICPGIQAEHRVNIGPNEYRTISYTMSPQGLRDRVYGPKQPGEYRILMLGDSFTMGDAVNEDDTIPRCLERELKLRAPLPSVSVINAGMSGAGPIQELGMLRERGLAFEPDLVILQIFPGNDIDNSLELTGKRLRACDPLWHNVLNEFLLRGTLPYRIDSWFYIHFQTYREIVVRAHKTPFIANLIAATRFFSPDLLKEYPPSENRPFWLEVSLRSWYPELEEGLQLLTSYIAQMRDECTARGIPFIAYIIPLGFEVNEEFWKALTKKVPDQAEYERLKAITKVEAALDHSGISHFSILNALLSHPKIDELYYLLDGHLTPLGNRIAAHRIADYLCNEFWPKAGGKSASLLSTTKRGDPNSSDR